MNYLVLLRIKHHVCSNYIGWQAEISSERTALISAQSSRDITLSISVKIVSRCVNLRCVLTFSDRIFVLFYNVHWK